jgi:glycosyltransferase involved in cell wall biosynthesis
VSEAVRIGVPVIASKISGNVGLLGDQYGGYYPPGNERALAALILRTASEPRFYRGRIRKLARLRPIAGPGNEKRMLGNAIAAGIRQA